MKKKKKKLALLSWTLTALIVGGLFTLSVVTHAAHRNVFAFLGIMLWLAWILHIRYVVRKHTDTPVQVAFIAGSAIILFFPLWQIWLVLVVVVLCWLENIHDLLANQWENRRRKP